MGLLWAICGAIPCTKIESRPRNWFHFALKQIHFANCDLFGMLFCDPAKGFSSELIFPRESNIPTLVKIVSIAVMSIHSMAHFPEPKGPCCRQSINRESSPKSSPHNIERCPYCFRRKKIHRHRRHQMSFISHELTQCFCVADSRWSHFAWSESITTRMVTPQLGSSWYPCQSHPPQEISRDH